MTRMGALCCGQRGAGSHGHEWGSELPPGEALLQWDQPGARQGPRSCWGSSASTGVRAAGGVLGDGRLRASSEDRARSLRLSLSTDGSHVCVTQGAREPGREPRTAGGAVAPLCELSSQETAGKGHTGQRDGETEVCVSDLPGQVLIEPLFLMKPAEVLSGNDNVCNPHRHPGPGTPVSGGHLCPLRSVSGVTWPITGDVGAAVKHVCVSSE